ncbi:hypothetical protein ACOMHN_055806 [Nucella lapillus]
MTVRGRSQRADCGSQFSGLTTMSGNQPSGIHVLAVCPVMNSNVQKLAYTVGQLQFVVRTSGDGLDSIDRDSDRDQAAYTTGGRGLPHTLCCGTARAKQSEA